MTELDKLIDAVAAGDDEESKSLIRRLGVMDVIDPDQHGWAISAYRGSLDAAKALHDALLPGWFMADLGNLPKSGDWVCVLHPKDLSEQRQKIERNATPARAWLLAILRAYRATQEQT